MHSITVGVISKVMCYAYSEKKYFASTCPKKEQVESKPRVYIHAMHMVADESTNEVDEELDLKED